MGQILKKVKVGTDYCGFTKIWSYTNLQFVG